MRDPDQQRLLDEIAFLPDDDRRRFLDATVGKDLDLLTAMEELLRSPQRLSSEIEEQLERLPWETFSAVLESRRKRVGSNPTMVGVKVGHVTLEKRIGRGGMGEVYRAFDDRLGRAVAVKVLGERLRFRPGAEARFRREARILAQLEHPALCQIYDLVEVEDNAYLILELVDGESLRMMSARLSDRQRIDIAIQLAEAVVAAHRAGVVHRDLKPDNVMVTKDDRIKVLDFGIARLEVAGEDNENHEPEDSIEADLAADGDSLDLTFRTRRGSILGTVAYMSPEQARGEEVGAPSDIYSLGVMLHELFTGSLPYPDLPRKQTLERVRSGEVELSSDARQPLASLLLSQLSTDPRLRPAAEAVGHELCRIRDEPKKRKRRRLVFTAMIGALSLVATMVVMLVRARIDTRLQTEAARVFGQKAGELGWRMRAERLAPAHDLRPVDAALRSQIVAFEERMGELGGSAIGPGNAALGRAYFELGDLGAARQRFENAWKAGHRTGEVGFGLGQVLGELYLAEKKKALRSGGRAAQKRSQAAARQEMQDNALRYLEVARRENVIAVSYIEGLVALFEERFDQARLKAAEARATSAWLFEADILEARSYEREAIVAAYVENDLERAEPLFLAASEAFERAATLARSSRAALRGSCSVAYGYVEFLSFGALQRRVPEEALRKAEESCAAALILDPEDVELLLRIEAMWSVQAQAAAKRGEDPEPLFERALEIGRTAVELAPEQEGPWHQRAFVRIVQGLTRNWRGGSSGAAFDAALADIRKSVMVDKNHSNISTFALALGFRGQLALDRGNDPRQWLDECIQEAAAENARHQVVDYIWHREAECRLWLGIWKAQHGEGRDGLESLEKAVELWRRISQSFPAKFPLAEALSQLGGAKMTRGSDPTPFLAESLSLADALGELGEGATEPSTAGFCYLRQARYLELVGRDASAEIDAAVRWAENARQRAPLEPAYTRQLAAAHLIGARLALTADRSPALALSAAEAALDTSERQFSGDSRTSLLRAQLAILSARWEHRQGRSTHDLFDRASFLLSELESSRPSDPMVHQQRARLGLALASSLKTSTDRWAAIDEGLDAIDDLLDMNPESSMALALRGSLLSLAASTPDRGGEAEKRRLGAEALRAFLAACNANPLDVTSCNRGRIGS